MIYDILFLLINKFQNNFQIIDPNLDQNNLFLFLIFLKNLKIIIFKTIQYSHVSNKID